MKGNKGRWLTSIYTTEIVKSFYFLKNVEMKVLVTIKVENTFILSRITTFFELDISFTKSILISKF